MLFRARIIVAFSQAKTKAAIITPTNTAMAKSSKTVTVETTTKINASLRGILFIIRKLLQAKVPITTINITPTKAAIDLLIDLRSKKHKAKQSNSRNDS